MGKGDKRTRRGKLFNRSYGKRRVKVKNRTLKNKAKASGKAKAKK